MAEPTKSREQSPVAGKDAAPFVATDGGRLELNRKEAERYLNLLDATATGFCFWAGHDKDDNAKPWQRYGTLADRWADIERLNREGYGVFVAVNTTDATGRRQARNITATRAIWHEDDVGYAGAFPVAPPFTVQSSPG